MREKTRRDWPTELMRACADLNTPVASAAAAHIEASAPALRQRVLVVGPTPVPKTSATIVPIENIGALNVEAAPLPRRRPASIPAEMLVPVANPAAIASLTSICTVDEKGRTTTGSLDGSRAREVVPVQTQMLSSGIVLLVPTSCIVKSPIAGKVLFVGIFKGYRGVVILSIGRGRQMIVAGLGTLNVLRGDIVTRGMIIGSTSLVGAPALATAFGNSGDASRSLLYFDLKTANGTSKNVFQLADAR